MLLPPLPVPLQASQRFFSRLMPFSMSAARCVGEGREKRGGTEVIPLEEEEEEEGGRFGSGKTFR